MYMENYLQTLSPTSKDAKTMGLSTTAKTMGSLEVTTL